MYANIRPLPTLCFYSYRVYCMMGDGECSEGSVWEAMAFASYYKLDNLVAIMDVNRLGQSEAAPLKHDMETYRKRCEGFGSVPSFSFTLLFTFHYLSNFKIKQSFWSYSFVHTVNTLLFLSFKRLLGGVSCSHFLG